MLLDTSLVAQGPSALSLSPVSAHLGGVVQQEFTAELHQVTFQRERGCDIWSWGRALG